MQIGLVGLGRMGGNMRERLRRGGHEVIGYDRDPGVSDVGSPSELVAALPSPKVVWVMVPSGDPTHATIDELAGLLDEGDVIVDGGNSRWTDDQKHAATLAEHGIGFVDCGVSGGVWGLDDGYGLMSGGDAEHVALVQPIFDTLKPPGMRATSTPAASEPATSPRWSTTASSTAACRRTQRATSSSRRPRSSTTSRMCWRRGARARSFGPGCSIYSSTRCDPTRACPRSPAGPTTRARADGLWRRRSTTPYPSTPSRPRCSRDSARGRRR